MQYGFQSYAGMEKGDLGNEMTTIITRHKQARATEAIIGNQDGRCQMVDKHAQELEQKSLRPL